MNEKHVDARLSLIKRSVLGRVDQIDDGVYYLIESLFVTKGKSYADE